MYRLILLNLFLACAVSFLSGCGEKKPTSVTEGISPSALEEYQANEKRLQEETEQSMKDDKS